MARPLRPHTDRISTGYSQTLGWSISKTSEKILKKPETSYYVTDEKGQKYWLGHETVFEKFRGLGRPGYVKKSVQFSYKEYIGQYGGWAYIMQPTAVCESSAEFSVYNSWDSAALTLGFLQMAAHTGQHLHQLFKDLIVRLPEEAAQYFPELMVGSQLGASYRKDGLYAVNNNGVHVIDLDRQAAHPDNLGTPQRNKSDRGPFMAFFNPDRAGMDGEEIETAARWIVWMSRSAKARAVVTDNAVRVLKETATGLSDQLRAKPTGAYQSGLHGMEMALVSACLDVFHHGRSMPGLSRLDTIRFALQQNDVAARLKAFAAIGTKNWHIDRSKTCVAEIEKLMSHFGKHKYDAPLKDFVRV